MSGLPKIALARLKAIAGAGRSSGSSENADDFPCGKHPDANLLAALAEQTLTQWERTQVLTHLSQCADCRAVAALMSPPKAPMGKPAAAAAKRNFNPWVALLSGAAAGVLGSVTLVILLHSGAWKRPLEIAKATPPAGPARSVPNIPRAVHSPAIAVPLKAPAPAEVQKLAGRRATARAREQGPELQGNGAGAGAHGRMTLMAPNRAGLSRSESRGMSKVEREYQGINVPIAAPSPASANTAIRSATPAQAGKVSREAQTASKALPSMTESVEVTAASAPAASAAKDAAPASTEKSSRVPTRAAIGEMMASRKKKEFEVGQSASLWTVAADGKVQRSTDGGKSFKHIHVAHHTRFRAIASLANDVWVAGVGGTLFHSSNGGLTWTGIPIIWEGNTITETIAGIQLRDPQHLVVTGDSGSQWATEDGGQHWLKQR